MAPYLTETFESDDRTAYRDPYTSGWRLGTHDSVTTNESRSGDACLRVPIWAGGHYGMDATIDPKDAGLTNENQMEMYTSYWVKFDENFKSDSNGGKLPGPRQREPPTPGVPTANGYNGWSCLGKFSGTSSGDVTIGYYWYHMDQSGRYGDHINATTVERGKWHHIEQHIKVNTVSGDSANRDGELDLWVNGEHLVDRNNVRYTIGDRWRGINWCTQLYYGGSQSSPRDNTVYLDDIAISRTRIGHPGPSANAPVPAPDPEGTRFELITDPSVVDVRYSFVADGPVVKITDVDPKAEAHDDVSPNPDGTVTVNGISGTGHGDAYWVDGTVTDIEYDPGAYTLRWDGNEVTADDLPFGGTAPAPEPTPDPEPAPEPEPEPEPEPAPETREVVFTSPESGAAREQYEYVLLAGDVVAGDDVERMDVYRDLPSGRALAAGSLSAGGFTDSWTVTGPVDVAEWADGLTVTVDGESVSSL